MSHSHRDNTNQKLRSEIRTQILILESRPFLYPREIAALACLRDAAAFLYTAVPAAQRSKQIEFARQKIEMDKQR